ncbi:MAG TPA: hypothetical protein DGG95_02860 [Cytophagales bacterium]|jgi:hypothetical protein|nr:hypothetical protein [Cytophagales bacterium]
MKISTLGKGLFFFAVLFLIGFVVFDQLFSAPKIHRGIVLHKVFVPEHTVVSPYVPNYARARNFNYDIHTQQYDQWIAFVKADDGDTLKVHCTSHHYEVTKLGDTLLFKEYKGDVFGIDYLSHSEEDTIKSDMKKNGKF